MPKAKAQDWHLIGDLLNGTLRSIKRQTSDKYKIILASHELPDNFDRHGLDIVHLRAKWGNESIAHLPYRDKSRKKYMLATEVFKRGGGYTMLLDADDRISNRFVESVYDKKSENGYIVNEGYAYDFMADKISTIPGAWPKPFHFYCGSCAVLNLKPSEPRDGDTSQFAAWADAQDQLLVNHPKWVSDAAKRGRPLEPFNFRAVTYLQNTGENSHAKIDTVRRDEAAVNIVANEIFLSDAIRAEFAL